MASSLWLSGSPPPGDTALKALLTPAPPALLEKYHSLSEDLALELHSPGMSRGQKRQPERGKTSEFETSCSTDRDIESDHLPGKRARRSSGFVEDSLKEEWGTFGTQGKVRFRSLENLMCIIPLHRWIGI